MNKTELVIRISIFVLICGALALIVTIPTILGLFWMMSTRVVWFESPIIGVAYIMALVIMSKLLSPICLYLAEKILDDNKSDEGGE